MCMSDHLLRENPMLGRARAEEEVRARAVSILQIAAVGTINTLGSLQKVVENFRTLPGRKVLFLLSDGFFLESKHADARDRIRRVTTAAAASSFVIYSIDARGLPTGHERRQYACGVRSLRTNVARQPMGELGASQDGLNALANDTGGRAFFNSNALSVSVQRGLKEASVYYLLAWRPDTDEAAQSETQRLEVSVVGRPDLFVRSRTSVGDVAVARNETQPEGYPEPDCRNARSTAVRRSADPLSRSK